MCSSRTGCLLTMLESPVMHAVKYYGMLLDRDFTSEMGSCSTGCSVTILELFPCTTFLSLDVI